MGKVFGISDLPVSLITTPFEPIVVPKDPSLAGKKSPIIFYEGADKFVSNSYVCKQSGFIKNITKNLSRKVVK